MGINEREIADTYIKMYSQLAERVPTGTGFGTEVAAILTAARVLKRTMEKCAIEISCSIDQVRPPSLTLSQANAIIDMEDHGYSEGLGPETETADAAWDEMVVWAEAATGRKAVRNA
jgi:hypothetical protein